MLSIRLATFPPTFNVPSPATDSPVPGFIAPTVELVAITGVPLISE